MNWSSQAAGDAAEEEVEFDDARDTYEGYEDFGDDYSSLSRASRNARSLACLYTQLLVIQNTLPLVLIFITILCADSNSTRLNLVRSVNGDLNFTSTKCTQAALCSSRVASAHHAAKMGEQAVPVVSVRAWMRLTLRTVL
jgi:hypothetical protein